MSTTSLPGGFAGNAGSSAEMQAAEQAAQRSLVRSLQALASLKLTIVLFVMAMFIVFVGSLAQSRRDVWLVMSQYFRTYIAWIDVADFFPPSMFPRLGNFDWDSLGVFRRFPFPGGWLIGWVMLANLLSAHFLKFRIRVRGARLAGGILVVLIGILLTAAVIVTGNAQTGVESGDYALTADQIWYTLLGMLAVTAVICFSVAAVSSESRAARGVMAAAGLVMAAVFLYFVAGGESARLNLSSMRILWQLLKGSACSLVLLLGCNLLFEKRGGIVLLHAGVAMLMFSELQVGIYGKENQLMLLEGQKSSFMRDIREREIAIVRRLDDGKDKVVVIPQLLLESAAAETAPERQIIPLESLPFDIAVRRFMQNSDLRARLPDDNVSTTQGLGEFAVPNELPPVTGMEESSDVSSAYVDIVERGTGKVLSTHLLSQSVSELRSVPIAEPVRVGSEDFQLYLRFQRNYRPYEVELLDVSRTNYVGSSTPRDYRSRIVIREPGTGTSEEFTLWMNNPLRYRGETFYQSSYNKLENGKEATTLSVVRNKGWMLPYIACMIVSFGMFAQFWQTVSRHLKREERTADGSETYLLSTSDLLPASDQNSDMADENSAIPAALRKAAAPARRPQSSPRAVRSAWTVIAPLIVVLACGGWLAGKARVPSAAKDSMNLYGFAQIPIAWNGRAQPVDSFARTHLMMNSHKSTFEGELDRLELDAEREKLLKAFAKYWPSVDASTLKEFSGTYEEWIARMMKLTSSGSDVVEERMRPLMARKMPAVRWFLDLAARPDMSLRHRVVKIDDDQLLSLLALPKRKGLSYSLAEIKNKLPELEPIRREAMKLQMNKQDNLLTTQQRRVSGLFETVTRIEDMRNMFRVQESDGLLGPLVDSWRILHVLGDRPAVMGVPTGVDNEQRSWETVVASYSLLQLSQQLKQRNINTEQELAEVVKTQLPNEMAAEIPGTMERTLEILSSAMAAQNKGQVDPKMVQSRAAEAAERMRSDDPFISGILEVIAAAEPGQTAEQMAAGMSKEKKDELANSKISSQLFEIFSIINSESPDDKRLNEIRRRLLATGKTDPAAVAREMNTELAGLALTDIRARAGDLLPGGSQAEIFERNTKAFTGILAAWTNADVAAFNQGVSDYRTALKSENLPHLDADVVSAEAWFNFFEPFYKATNLYLVVLLLAFLGWVFWGPVLRSTAFWLMVLTFVVHTGALLLRIWISGRPPVTNLYSSAIFIGWAVVISAFAIERILKNGIGTILGASTGAATLTIAHYLARDEGDTLGVMQAVLDTTFWLATHVVCITLGYAATFLAGGIGIMYCLTTSLKSSPERLQVLKKLGSLVYGVLCFAVFFSLVGTVLGGLWADDSWGRFWGWDPKENGAMLIVLWNAVILHARWDRIVRDYGTAVLSIIGNIVTAWSWFGVNELKAGLHTYGFTEGRLLALALFVALQAALVAVALIVYQRRRSAAAVTQS